MANSNLTTISILGFLSFGIALGVALGGNDNIGLYEFIHKWKELFGPLIAIIAVWAAIYNSTNQINTTFTLKKEEFDRENKASRAVLNFALSKICRYAELYISFLDNLANDRPGAPPEIDDSILDSIFNCIRFGTKEETLAMATLLSELQVHKARTSAIIDHNEEINDLWIEGMIIRALNIYTDASNLFNYSRFHDDEHGFMSVYSAFRINRRRFTKPVEIQAILERRLGPEQ